MWPYIKLLVVSAALACAAAYKPPVSLGALQVCLVKERNVCPLMIREDRFMGIGTPEGVQMAAGIKSLPYIRDVSIRIEDDLWVFFLSDDVHLAFHHLHRFIRDSEKWEVYCKTRQTKVKEFALQDAVRPLLLRTYLK